MGFVDLAAETSVQEAITEIDSAITKIDAASEGIETVNTGIGEIKASIVEVKEMLNRYNVPVYGFIEHMAILNPAQRIEYIEKNKNFTPVSMNFSTHVLNYGSWNDFWFLRANRPAMVRFDGTLDYYLNPDDYTKREDGTASDVANVDYAGGAYAWIPKIYKYEYIIGDDRYVLFSQQKINDNFIAAGFIDPDGNELDGVWIPMFYGKLDATGKMRTLALGNPSAGGAKLITQQQYDAIAACGTRHVFLGGAIMNTLADLLVMFAKTTNTQAAYGDGASASFNNSVTNYGTLDDAVVGGGQFYGTNTGKSLNKILHSLVLGSYSVWIRDPYTLLIDGVYWVSKNYNYDPTGAAYINTGIRYFPINGFIAKMEVST